MRPVFGCAVATQLLTVISTQSSAATQARATVACFQALRSKFAREICSLAYLILREAGREEGRNGGMDREREGGREGEAGTEGWRGREGEREGRAQGGRNGEREGRDGEREGREGG